jgi:hypothetical protein
VPPAPTIWTAVLTAVAAFAGVLVAQWWTSRREDRNWERQLQMYATQWEDQRERDREQREDQRARDEAQWRREEARRFVDERRRMYADFLTAATQVEEAIDHQIFNYGQDDDEARNIRASNLTPVLQNIKDHLWGKLDAFRLVAPEPVVDHGSSYVLWLIDEVGGLRSSNTIPYDIAQKRRDLRDRLRLAMREDVTGSYENLTEPRR